MPSLHPRVDKWLAGAAFDGRTPASHLSTLARQTTARQKLNLNRPYLGQPQVFCFFFSKKKRKRFFLKKRSKNFHSLWCGVEGNAFIEVIHRDLDADLRQREGATLAEGRGAPRLVMLTPIDRETDKILLHEDEALDRCNGMILGRLEDTVRALGMRADYLEDDNRIRRQPIEAIDLRAGHQGVRVAYLAARGRNPRRPPPPSDDSSFRASEGKAARSDCWR